MQLVALIDYNLKEESISQESIIETKMARFRVDASRDTGEVMLMIETECGYRPVMGWPDAERLKEFAEMLIGVYSSIDDRNNDPKNIADKLIEETFSD